jgi:hypothetical protein
LYALVVTVILLKCTTVFILAKNGIPRSWMLIIPNILDSIIPELIIKQQGFALLIWLLCVGRSSKHRYAKLSDPGKNKESQFVFCTEAKVGSISQFFLNLNLRCPAIYILMSMGISGS